jgi:hypothetical protein
VPFVRPVIVQPVLALPQLAEPGLAEAVYPVMAAPPFEAGATQATASWPSPAVSVAAVGAPGSPAQKLPDVVEVAEVQFASRAFTTGVSCALVVTSVVRPETPVASVLTPSDTS